MTENELLFHESQINSLLAETFRKHGINCDLESNLLIFEKQQINAHARLFDRTTSSVIVLQLDIKLEISPGKEIVESFAGFGNDADTAVRDVYDNFLRNSFHVLLGAFFTDKYDREINRYKWDVNGRTFEIVMGQIGIRGKRLDNLPMKWLIQFEEMVKSMNLSDDTHWIRLYFAQSNGKISTREILLDNDIWIEAEPLVNTFDFPIAESFLSLRVFLVMKNCIDII